MSEEAVNSIYKIKANNGTFEMSDGDYIAKSSNIIYSSTWLEPRHGTEKYGAARENKLIGGEK